MKPVGDFSARRRRIPSDAARSASAAENLFDLAHVVVAEARQRVPFTFGGGLSAKCESYWRSRCSRRCARQLERHAG